MLADSILGYVCKDVKMLDARYEMQRDDRQVFASLGFCQKELTSCAMVKEVSLAS